MREQKANDNGFPVVGEQAKEQQIFPFDQLVKYDGATNTITVNANLTINGDTNVSELDIDSGEATKGQVITADGDSGASWENRVAYLNLESESGDLTDAQIEVAEQDNVIITLDGQFYYKNSQSDESIVFKAPTKVVDDDTIVEKVVIDLSDNTYSYSYEVVAAGASFEPTYDDELNDASTNAPQTKVVYAALAEKADTEKIENGEIVAGKSQVAESLETQVGKLDQTPFAYMSSGGQTDIESGIQRSIKLVGVNLVKNQLVSDTLVESSNTTINASSAQELNLVPLVQGHKYLLMFDLNNDASGSNLAFGYYNTSFSFVTVQENLLSGSLTAGKKTFIITVNNAVSNFLNTSLVNRTTDSLSLGHIIYTDITQRYGSNEVVEAIIGSDTSKQVARLIQFDPSILKDLSFDTGSMVTVTTAFLKSTGYNMWNEQWEVGSFNQTTGEKITADKIRSKDPIRVEPYSKIGYIGGGYGAEVFLYDANMNYIGYEVFGDGSVNTIPSNVYYINIAPSTSYGTTYNHDICIFQYWDGSRIGYEPFDERIEPMPNVEINGILKVDASGNVYADGDELYPDNTKNKKRYGKYTFTGNENWGAYGSGYVAYVLTNRAKEVASSEVSNTLTNIGLQASTRNDISNGLGGINTSGNAIVVSNTSNLTGKTVIYELAEEESLEANSYSPNLWADDFGHLQMLDEDGNEINGLQGCEIFYKANISGFAESVYVRAEGEPENVVVQNDINDTALAERGYLKLASLSGYDDTKTQTLKNIEGVFTWVDDE